MFNPHLGGIKYLLLLPPIWGALNTYLAFTPHLGGKGGRKQEEEKHQIKCKVFTGKITVIIIV
jgi:hypothetical protein